LLGKTVSELKVDLPIRTFFPKAGDGGEQFYDGKSGINFAIICCFGRTAVRFKDRKEEAEAQYENETASVFIV